MSDQDLGPRRSALEERRHQKRVKTTVWGAVGVILAVSLGTAAVLFSVGRAIDEPTEPEPQATQEGPSVSTMLVVGTNTQADGDYEVTWVSLIASDPDRGRGAVGYIPAGTAVEVPGRGLQSLGDAYRTGGIPLLLVTAENLLGITLDRYVEISDGDLSAIAQQIAPLTVDVPSEVRVKAGPGTNRVIFTKGAQSLSPEFIERLLYTVGVDGDEASLGARHIAFWDAVFDRYSDDPQELRRSLRRSEGAFGKTDGAPAEVIEEIVRVASLPSASRSLRTLSVSPLQVPGATLYVAEASEIEAFVTDVAGAEVATQDQVRVQILNGNGEPGIGQEVATRLVGEGFRVILSGNARSLDHEETLIITYDSDAESRALAERARELLGVGEVQVSTQDQGIVDLTIVVGKDFLRTR